MNTNATSPLLRRTLIFVAVFTGLAVPLRASGVAAEQAAIGLAFLGTLFILARSPDSRIWLKHVLTSVEAKLVVFIFIAWTVTVFFSFDPLGSSKMALRTGVLILGSIAIGSVLHNQIDTQRVLWKAIIITGLGFVILAVLSLNGVPMIAALLKGKMVTSTRPDLGFKAFGASAMCMIPVTAWAGRKLDGNWRWLGYAFTPLALVVIIMTANRAALAGFLAMAITGIVLLAVAQRRHIKALLASALAIIVSIFSWIRAHELGTLSIDGTYMPEWLVDPHRQNIWKFAYERFLDHPLVGNGLDQLNHLPGATLSVPGLPSSAAFVPSHPHNWSLEILSETGLIGFIPVLFALGFILWRILRSYLATADETDLTLVVLMAGFWSSAFFNFSIWAAWWQLTFFILFAILASSRKQRI